MKISKSVLHVQVFSGSSDSKESTGNQGSIPGSGKSPGEGNGYSLQYFCLENPMGHATCSPWGRKELDTTEQLTYIHTQVQKAKNQKKLTHTV